MCCVYTRFVKSMLEKVLVGVVRGDSPAEIVPSTEEPLGVEASVVTRQHRPCVVQNDAENVIRCIEWREEFLKVLTNSCAIMSYDGFGSTILKQSRQILVH